LTELQRLNIQLAQAEQERRILGDNLIGGVSDPFRTFFDQLQLKTDIEILDVKIAIIKQKIESIEHG